MRPDFRLKNTMKLILFIYSLLILIVGPAAARADLILARNSSASVVIVTPESATASESRACQELAVYLGRITGGQFKVVKESAFDNGAPAIYVGPTKFAREAGVQFDELSDEEWTIRADDHAVILAGGRPRGTLYAVYHFLEDHLGIRWWNPFEEHVPAQNDLAVPHINRQSKPAFAYRVIHYSFTGAYDWHGGQFSARNRLNSASDEPISQEFGGDLRIGRPKICNTLHYFIDKDKDFQAHPEWFALKDGKRIKESQLCLKNPELRAHFLGKLKDFIKASNEDANARHLVPPVYYAVDQADGNLPWCQCPTCQAVINREQSPAGLMLDFVNKLANDIKNDYPKIRIMTLAYLETEKAPLSIRPADNVVVRLTDTASNMIEPITDRSNTVFRERLEKWSRIAPGLQIWDYGVTYTSIDRNDAIGTYLLPLPSQRAYSHDFQFMQKQGVQGFYIQHEYEIGADMRDMKIWLQARLMEDPSRDPDALIEDFISGYYGPAAGLMREYLARTEESAIKSGSFIDWCATPSQYKYLTPEFLNWAEEQFAKAEATVADNNIYLRRVRHARLSVDGAILGRYPQLMAQLARQKNSEITFNRQDIADRFLATWQEQGKLRQTSAFEKSAGTFIRDALAMKSFPLPDRFASTPLDRIYDFPAFTMKISPGTRPVELVQDSEAATGEVVRVDVARLAQYPNVRTDWYGPPLLVGMFDRSTQKAEERRPIQVKQIKSGYQWYNLGTYEIQPSSQAYFFGGWDVMLPLADVGGGPRRKSRCDIWASIKFDGPSYNARSSHPADCVSIERIIVIAR